MNEIDINRLDKLQLFLGCAGNDDKNSNLPIQKTYPLFSDP